MSKQNFYQIRVIDIDKKATLQASHFVLGPNSGYHIIDLNNYNNLCSTCLNKISNTSKEM